MNLQELHKSNKNVSTLILFKGELGTATAIQLQRKGVLKEHITRTSALLLCVEGMVTYKDETGLEVVLERGEYIQITPNVKHWLYASTKSQLVLIK